MELINLSKPLTVDQIEFRVQSINNGGYATILAYKDARVDMQRLDSVCGPLGWKREHNRDNRNCVISVYDEKNKHWVSKEDTGSESNAEAQKGLASDSFKRAGFNWGIGRELYDYPVISIKLNGGANQNSANVEWYKQGNNPKSGWGLKLKEWRWYSEFEGKKITFLAASDQNNQTRFTWGQMKPKENNQ